MEESYLSVALQLGIEYEKVWTLTPKKLNPYIKAFQEKEKRELEHANFTAWLTGLYVGYSLISVFGENSQYPEKPLDLFTGELTADEQLKREEQLVAAYVAMFNQNF